MTDYQPREVTTLLALLEERTGTPATLTSRPGRWHIEHGNDRIKLTCIFARNTSGKLGYRSTLAQDGNPRDTVKDIDAYVRLFTDPDLAHPNRTPGRTLSPITPIPEGQEMPELVATLVAVADSKERITGVEAGYGVKSHLERHGDHNHRVPEEDENGNYVTDPERYSVRFTKENGDRIQIELGPAKGVLAIEDVAAVDADGGDILSEEKDPGRQATDIITGVIERLLGFRLPSATSTAGSYQSPGVRTTGAVTNSVQVRRASVIRT